MQTLALLLEYDGAAFVGWQRQPPPQRTVQAAVETALSTLAKTPTQCVAAGRTDTGVHALGQVASTHCAASLPPDALWRALNALLPREVAVRALARVSPDFHALRDARGKHYAYRLWTGPARSPLRSAQYAYLPALGALDLDALREAARHFEGTHDFRSLEAAGSSAATTCRTLHRVGVQAADGVLRFDVEGDGFLRHMVRNLVGTLLEVGAGRLSPEAMPALLEARDRARAGPTAPPEGLVLVSVRYDPAIAWEAGSAAPAALP